VQRATAQQMHVQMKHRLPRLRSGVDHQAVALAQILLLRERLGGVIIRPIRSSSSAVARLPIRCASPDDQDVRRRLR